MKTATRTKTKKVDPERSAAAKRAWETIRANKAAAKAATAAPKDKRYKGKAFGVDRCVYCGTQHSSGWMEDGEGDKVCADCSQKIMAASPAAPSACKPEPAVTSAKQVAASAKQAPKIAVVSPDEITANGHSLRASDYVDQPELPQKVGNLPAVGVSCASLTKALGVISKLLHGEKNVVYGKMLHAQTVDGELELRATRRLPMNDEDQEVIVRIPAAGALSPTLINVKELLQTVKACEAKVIALALASESYCVVAGCAARKFQVPARSVVNDYPLPVAERFKDQLSGKHAFGHEAGPFLEAVRYCLPAASKDETRVSCLNLLFDGFRFISTDTHRLHVSAMNRGPAHKPATTVISAQTLALVSGVAKAGTSDLSLLSHEEVFGERSKVINRLNFKVEQVSYSFTDRLEVFEFPPWERIPPAEFNTKITVDRDQLYEALTVARKVAAGKGTSLPVIFDIEIARSPDADDQLHLSSRGWVSMDVAMKDQAENKAETTHKDSISCKVDCWSAKAGKLGLNVPYLLDALSGLTGPKVTIGIVDDSSPVQINSKDDQTRFAIVMPVRV